LRVEFFLMDAMEVANFAPVCRSLRAKGVDARLIASPRDAHGADENWLDFENAVELLMEQGIPYSTRPDYDCELAVTTQRSLHLNDYRGLKVRLAYTVGLYESEELQETRARGFDAVLVQGAYAKPFIARWLGDSKVSVVGFPKYDAFFLDPPDRVAVARSLGLSPTKKVAVYLPTWEARSSLDVFLEPLEDVARRCNVQILVKPHHCTPRFEPERYRRLKRSAHLRLLPTNFPSAELFAVSDLAVVDALSGVMGEAILTYPEKPLICLCPNRALLDSQMDPAFEKICPTLTRPGELSALACRLSLEGATEAEQLEARATARDRLFAFKDGTAADHAAEAMIGLVERQLARL